MRTSKSIKKIVAFISLTFFIGITYASKPAAETLQNSIKSVIQYPNEAIQSGIQGEVTVDFKLADHGAIQIVKLISTNPLLGKYVKDSLLKITVEDIESTYNQYFQINLKFELES